MIASFLPPARQELSEAVDYYDSLQPGLGDEFASEVENAIQRILHNPQAWPKLSQSVRRCRLRRFPYSLIFQVAGDRILVLAVMHLRRRPDYWGARIPR